MLMLQRAVCATAPASETARLAQLSSGAFKVRFPLVS